MKQKKIPESMNSGVPGWGGERMRMACHVFGKVVADHPAVELVDPVPNDADLAFKVPLSKLIDRLNRDELLRLLENRFWCDVIGEILLRRNTSHFIGWLTEKPGYEERIERRRHRHFGVGIDGDDVVFSCYASKLAEILNDELADVLWKD